MLLISHRGNLNGPNTAMENDPNYIQRALDMHYDVEVDLWYSTDNKLYLGHDRPDYRIRLHWLRERSDRLWIHCKNSEALVFMTKNPSFGLHYFYHRNDLYTMTSQGYIWCHPTSNIAPMRAISVMPETICGLESVYEKRKNFYGICSDYVADLDKELD